MKYLKVDRDFIDFSLFSAEIEYLFVEIDLNGIINREIGVNSHNNIVHKYPSTDYKHGAYGIMDLVSLVLDFESNLSKERFELFWSEAIEN